MDKLIITSIDTRFLVHSERFFANSNTSVSSIMNRIYLCIAIILLLLLDINISDLFDNSGTLYIYDTYNILQYYYNIEYIWLVLITYFVYSIFFHIYYNISKFFNIYIGQYNFIKYFINNSIVVTIIVKLLMYKYTFDYVISILFYMCFFMFILYTGIYYYTNYTIFFEFENLFKVYIGLNTRSSFGGSTYEFMLSNFFHIMQYYCEFGSNYISMYDLTTNSKIINLYMGIILYKFHIYIILVIVLYISLNKQITTKLYNVYSYGYIIIYLYRKLFNILYSYLLYIGNYNFKYFSIIIYTLILFYVFTHRYTCVYDYILYNIIYNNISNIGLYGYFSYIYPYIIYIIKILYSSYYDIFNNLVLNDTLMWGYVDWFKYGSLNEGFIFYLLTFLFEFRTNTSIYNNLNLIELVSIEYNIFDMIRSTVGIYMFNLDYGINNIFIISNWPIKIPIKDNIILDSALQNIIFDGENYWTKCYPSVIKTYSTDNTDIINCKFLLCNYN
jgi:hypothetical protein